MRRHAGQPSPNGNVEIEDGPVLLGPLGDYIRVRPKELPVEERLRRLVERKAS